MVSTDSMLVFSVMDIVLPCDLIYLLFVFVCLELFTCLDCGFDCLYFVIVLISSL